MQIGGDLHVGDAAIGKPASLLVAQGTILVDGSLVIQPGATMTVAIGSTLQVKGPVTNGGVLDLMNGAMIVDYTSDSPIDAIRTMLQEGYDDGSWNGLGIRTSTAANQTLPRQSLGLVESSVLLGQDGGSFLGQDVDASAILIKFTLAGDANLDGVVDAVDGQRLTSHWLAPGCWADGDFDYSGLVDWADVEIFWLNYRLTLNAPAFSPDLAAGILGLPASSVPEPASMSLMTVLACRSLARRRRRAAAGMRR